ncbi:DUF6931 family protein [Methylobacterium dankookense]|uniref:Uncharacterized protein n=1 Tax=Methylobacterium dankookense TaxID=560405 RepID=A0A564FUQ3_9HYPH|nr:hypothetical protein [Methylobacterium dankookense]GJD57298.1 hypothetical protein IFDJLNFL_3199 [Methylobacterium dankookense]VUF11737.1 hypothetical protein MTDSW087_01421 [Methylobacterium dankookense]
MTGTRFSTARDLYAAFPSTERDINAEPTDEPPLTFLQRLRQSETPEDAVSFLAYALGRREGVWWAAQSVRLLCRIAAGQEDAPLQAAESWVRDPDDLRRREALRLGMTGNHRLATPWVALAAGWSGGNVGPSAQAVVQATPEMTPKAVRTAILVALATVSARDRSSRLQACIDLGVPLMRRTEG